MDHMGSPPLQPADPSSPNKRKRSLSNEPSTHPTPPAKMPKTHSNHLQINYLARQFSELLPLISTDDPLPSLLSLISDYDGVLQRHESMAGNLGARLLGPILIQRFERLFDGPPRLLKTNGKDGTSVTWLDVVEFARTKPEQFNLDKLRDGVPVCQFYTKQSRVEISEEDFVLIKSGMPQKLIPPQPIGEDEEKELGTLEILEKSFGGVVQLADQVSARARQLNHRLKNRKNAIISRREAESAAVDEVGRSPRSGELGSQRCQTNGRDSSSNSPTGGFTAVNSRYPLPNDRSSQHNGSSQPHPQTSNKTSTNGNTFHGASAATRAELLSNFRTKSDRPSPNRDTDQPRRLSNPPSRTSVPLKPNSKPYTDSMEYASVLMTTASPVPIPNTPSSLLPYVKPSPADRFDDSGPHKAEMMTRMEQLHRGDRVQPPCDRCRRLHMDCLKNLTACMGCTKKHAKCSWKDVEEQELRDHPFVARIKVPDEGNDTGSDGDGRGSGSGTESLRRKEIAREKVGVRDEELLGEETGDEDIDMGKEPGRPHSVRSMTPPSITITVTNEAVEERIEPPPLSLARSPTRDGPDLPRSEVETPDASVDRTRDPQPSLVAREEEDNTHDAPDPAESTYQAPQARMRTPVTCDTNGANGHDAQTQYEKDIYSQLSDATRDTTDSMRVYTAGSEPMQLDSSLTQQLMKAASSAPSLTSYPTEAQQMPNSRHEIQELQIPSNETQHMKTERLPTPPIQSEDLQTTQVVNQSFATQIMQT